MTTVAFNVWALAPAILLTVTGWGIIGYYVWMRRQS